MQLASRVVIVVVLRDLLNSLKLLQFFSSATLTPLKKLTTTTDIDDLIAKAIKSKPGFIFARKKFISIGAKKSF